MNATFRERLILVEQLFLIAVVAQDETALSKISLELSQLVHHFKAVEASGDLDDYTALFLSRMSRAIGATTQCMLECEDVLKAGIISCSSLPLSSDDLLPVSTSSPTFTPCRLLFSHTSSRTLILGHNNLLDECAYRWLMQNMCNPYPTSSQLRIIGDESMTSVAQVEFWFQEARDLVGWTKLSDEFFAGSLHATRTAAKRVYLERDDAIPFCIAFAFSKVKAFMESLFVEHSSLPTLTSHVGSSAQTLRPVPVVNDSHLNDLLVNKEIEDTAPPPSVAGCKRNLPEDTTTSLASDSHRPLKRLRAQSLHQVLPHSGSKHPLPNTFSTMMRSAAEALTDTSTIPDTSVRLSDPSFPVGSNPSLDALALNSTGQKQIDLYGSASEMVLVPPDPPISQGEMRGQQISEGSLLVPSERQPSPSANHRRHPFPGPAPTFEWPVPPSLDHPPSDSTGASQITVSPGASVDLSVFDWNSISNPLVETAMPTNQPASFYVPSSDLAAMNFGLPDSLLYPEQSVEQGYNYNLPWTLGDLGSLEDFSLLQFPIPTTFPPDVSASPPASLCPDNSTFPSSEMDWSAISDFVNQFSSFSAESSSAPSPSAISDVAPITPENSVCSLLPPSPPHEVDKPISVLDPSIPPSAFLPAESGMFTEDASSVWSMLCGLP